jgi:hypothetical protein
VTLPNAHAAVVDRRKVVDYLLNAAHPDNGGKAAFFVALGFTMNEAEALITALRALAAGNVTSSIGSTHGDKYVIDGLLASQTGRTGAIRTIWIIDRGSTTPRLVTAYPRE